MRVLRAVVFSFYKEKICFQVCYMIESITERSLCKEREAFAFGALKTDQCATGCVLI